MVDVDLLNKYLREGVVCVTFIKANGDERVMNCSLMENYIPNNDNKPKQKINNPDAIRVVDVDISSWRSFRYDSVKEIKV